MASKVERKDVFWYIVLRLIIVSSIFVAAIIILLSGAASVPMGPISSLFLAIYVLSAAYFLFYAFEKHHTVQAYMQVIFDLFLITAFVLFLVVKAVNKMLKARDAEPTQYIVEKVDAAALNARSADGWEVVSATDAGVVLKK